MYSEVEVKNSVISNVGGDGELNKENSAQDDETESFNDSSNNNKSRNNSVYIDNENDELVKEKESNAKNDGEEVKPNARSIPLTREAVDENNSVIITRVATEDTMSSSPTSSYCSSSNRVNNSSSNVLAMDPDAFEKKPSPILISKIESKSYSDNANKSSNNIRRKLDEGEITKSDQELEKDQMKNILGIINCPTIKLIKMLTALLEKIIHSNDELVNDNSSTLDCNSDDNENTDDYYINCLNAVASFKGKHVPSIGLEQYFHRMQKYCPTTNEVYLSLLIYFDRISKKCNSIKRKGYQHIHEHSNGNNIHNNDNSNNDNNADSQIFVMDSYNIHRLIITGVTVSTKFSSDFFYSNLRYSKVGGISLREMNYLELQFLILCDFNLLITIEEYERYAMLLNRFWVNSTLQTK